MNSFCLLQEEFLDLDLSASEALIFARIYSFSHKEGCGVYFGNMKDLAKWGFVEKRQASNIVHKLIEKGYIERLEEEDKYGVVRYIYKVKEGIVQNTGRTEKNDEKSDEKCIEIPQIMHREDVQSSVNNNIYNKVYNKESSPAYNANECKPKQEHKQLYKEYVKLTMEEYDKLVAKLGRPEVHDLIDRLNNYIGSKGKDPYKSHYFALLNRAKPKDNQSFKSKPTKEEGNVLTVGSMKLKFT